MSLKRNIFFTVVQTVFQAVTYLLLYRYLLDTIGIEKIGTWSIVLAATSAARISEVGMAGSITKFVSTFLSKNQFVAASESIQTASVTLAVVVASVLILFYPVLESGLKYFLPEEGVSDGLSMLPYALVSVWLTTVSNIWMSALDGCLRSDIRAKIMVLGSILLFGMSVILVGPYGLIGLAVAQITQGVLLLILGWIYLKKTLGVLPFLPYDWRINRFKEMFSYAVNFQINSIVMLLFDPATKILLAKFGDLATVGYFEMAQRFVTMSRNLIIQSNRVIVPVFAGIDKDKTVEHDQLYLKNMKYLVFIMSPLFAILLALIPSISSIWLGEINNKFIVIGCILTVSWYLNSLTAPAYFAYLGQGNLFWVTTSHVTMGVMNISLGYLFGSLFGWKGVIFSVSMSLIVGSLITAWSYQINIKLKIKDLFSKSDRILVFSCYITSLSILFLQWKYIKFSPLGTISAVLISIIIVYSFIVSRHPLSREVLSLVFKSNGKIN